MRELKLIRQGVVMGDEQPLTATLFQRMQTIAGRDLCELFGYQKKVTCHHAAQSVVLRHCSLQRPTADAQREHWNLHDMVHESTVKSVSGEQAKKAFRANSGNFGASPILHTFHKRHQAAVDEIGVLDCSPACIDHLAGCQFDLLALPQNLLANCARQRKKDAIEKFFACATQRTAPRKLSVNQLLPLMSTFAFKE